MLLSYTSELMRKIMLKIIICRVIITDIATYIIKMNIFVEVNQN